MHTKNTSRTYIQPDGSVVPAGAAGDTAADLTDASPMQIPQNVAADPGRHTSDHQSVVQGPAATVPATNHMNEDVASVPTAPAVDTNRKSTSRKQQPPASQTYADPANAPGSPAPAAPQPMVQGDPGNGMGNPPGPSTVAPVTEADPGAKTKPAAQAWETNRAKEKKQPANTAKDPGSATNQADPGWAAADPATLANIPEAAPDGASAPKGKQHVRFDSGTQENDTNRPAGDRPP